MRMLRHHPEIVVYDRHPYEQSFAKYWMHMLRVLSQPADHINSYEEETFYNEIFELGHNPFYDVVVSQQHEAREWFGREYVERLARFCQTSVDDLYSTIAAAQGQAPPTYFAEKHQWPNYMPVLMWEIYPQAKEIFLVRDFRDMVFSILAFDRKRGYSGLRPAGGPQRRGLRAHGAARDGAQPAQELGHPPRPRAPGALRGPDLATRPRPRAACSSTSSWTPRPQQVQQLLAGRRRATPTRCATTARSSGAEDSIGRWRREGDERFRELCNEVFGDMLGDFGYSEVGYVGQ